MIDNARPRIYLDTNIYIQAFEGGNSRLIELFCAEPDIEGAFLFTSELTLAELLVLPYRQSNDALISKYNNWTTNSDVLGVGPLDREVLQYAALLRSQYTWLKLPDAIHVSSAIGFECSHFLSSDKQFNKISDITHGRYGVVKTVPTPQYTDPESEAFDRLLSGLAK